MKFNNLEINHEKDIPFNKKKKKVINLNEYAVKNNNYNDLELFKPISINIKKWNFLDYLSSRHPIDD